MSIYDTLNSEQRRAVEHDKGPLLILAGAGSGKTRVLTHRIAYLIAEREVNPWNIMALTFTNKAAKEMRERVDRIVGFGSESIWVSTFHSTCVRILRRWIETIGYDRNFTIYDTDDQKTLMKEICKYLNIDTKNTKERAILSAISSAKDELITPEAYSSMYVGDYNKSRYAKAYAEYQKRLKNSNALDFDDLIVKTIELFQTNPEALLYYQNRFKYIMVDEYQDTNTAQFQLIRLLSSTTGDDGQTEHNLCVVGDDDQSIYKFRGANIYNILNFEKEYPDAKVIKLEQNYRSTKTILEAANEVIHHNQGRKDKSLWTDNAKGEALQYIQFENEYEEATHIADSISTFMQEHSGEYSDFAILYRTNAQSRILEEKLIYRNIPYKLVGGVNFYQRKEIKDILCYLKTIDNGSDDVAVKRIINIPKRGIGLTTIDRVSEYALNNDLSFYSALRIAERIPSLERSVSKLSSFVSLIEVLRSKLNNPAYTLEMLLNEILEATGYVHALEEEGTDEANDRIDNINELLNKVITYEQGCEDIPSLSEFLEEVSLVADIDNLDESNNKVILMTLHSAKGLEFPYVYLCGMEDGIFPSYMCITSDDPSEVEEERRLCYVGITRAMKRLSLSCARQRMIRGETQFNKPSRFIQEIPRYLITELPGSLSPRFSKRETDSFTLTNSYSSSGQNVSSSKNFVFSGKASTSKNSLFTGNPHIQKGFGQPLSPYSFDKPKAPSKMEDLAYQVGDTVSHVKFGTGIVLSMNAKGNDTEVSVEFSEFGVKKMLASFAKLKKL